MDPFRVLTGRTVVLPMDDVDTDQIIPARFLKAITFEGLEHHLFEDDRIEANGRGLVHPFDDGKRAGARVLLVGRNFGCGSSREHAPQAIVRWGIRAVVGESYSEIFFGNSVALGMPCVTADHASLAALMQLVEEDPAVQLVVDLEGMRASAGEKHFKIALPSAARESFLEGTWDATGLLLDRFEEVEAVARRLPYVSGTWS